eukprot:2489269-Rhodomonas_salina.4
MDGWMDTFVGSEASRMTYDQIILHQQGHSARSPDAQQAPHLPGRVRANRKCFASFAPRSILGVVYQCNLHRPASGRPGT